MTDQPEEPLTPHDEYVTMRYEAMARAVHACVAEKGWGEKLSKLEIAELCIAVGTSLEKLSRVRTMEQLDQVIEHANVQAVTEGADSGWAKVAMDAIMAKTKIYRMLP